MSSITVGQMREDAAGVFSDFPTETVTIGGTSYAALVMDMSEGSDWVEGGEVSSTTLRVALKRSDVVTMPSEGDSATFRSTTYTLGQVEQDDTGGNITIDLRLPSQ